MPRPIDTLFGRSHGPRDPLLARIAPGTPATLAGIREGDILKRIDDLDATTWRTDPRVMPMSRFSGKPALTDVGLTLDRGGDERVVEVVLKNILGPP